jgi:5-methylcytosine-specific restriction protein A
MRYRGSAASRGYGSKWVKARNAFLSRPENVFCVMCKAQGRLVTATVVDHKVPHKGDQGLFWDENNFQSLCKQHHDSSKQRDDRSGVIGGCDINGWPMDRANPLCSKG